MLPKAVLATALLATTLAWAAIPPNVQLSTTKALEEAYDVLTMPEINQRQVAKGKADLLYPALIQISRATSEPMQTRWRALSLASSLKSAEALPELEKALVAPEWFMRNVALLSMEKYHPQRAQAAAQSLLKDKALVVRSAAVEVLGKRMDEKTRDLFWEALASAQNFRRKQSLWIRGQMLGFLAQAPQAREASLFVKALKDDDRKIQVAAVSALEKLTQKTLGKSNMAIQEKRELWIQWAKARPSGVL